MTKESLGDLRFPIADAACSPGAASDRETAGRRPLNGGLPPRVDFRVGRRAVLARCNPGQGV
ncbi:hypothetical protein [Streptomyces sp. NPDC058678]|uniref:hypothetical protein n=1 Tax=Streptomyces sp. NPDC058678 TaxID=3346595 RepID=UPI00365F16B8